MNPVIRLKTIAAEMLKPIVQVVYCLFALCFVGYLVFGVFSGLDGAGWISHSHDTPVWIQGDWLVGEYRQCDMRSKMQPAGTDDLDRLPRRFCGTDSMGYIDFQLETWTKRQSSNVAIGGVTDSAFDSEFHVLPVSYHGRIDRDDKRVISWRCQRLSASLECKAIN